MPVRKSVLLAIALAAALCLAPAAQAQQASSGPPAAKAPATALSRDSRAALNRLYAGSPAAKALVGSVHTAPAFHSAATSQVQTWKFC